MVISKTVPIRSYDKPWGRIRPYLYGGFSLRYRLENWTSRTNYPARGIVSTTKIDVLYIQYNYGQPTARLDRYTLRNDGFASIHADYTGGTVTTKPFIFNGKGLYINYSTSAAGYIRAEMLDETGTAITGYTGSECTEIIGDSTEQRVTWGDKTDINALEGKPIRIRFSMKDADLFALQFK